jgi:lipoyl(octanoyl) transferase
MSVLVHRLGRVGYANALDLQRRFLEWRKAGGPDALLLLEHPPVLTLGRGAHAENIVASNQRLSDLGIEVYETDRGGDVTYHGPGQLVGYPLMHLVPGQQDVRKYVRRLEEVVSRTLADFGLAATRIQKWPGVWLENPDRKIAAIGVHLSRWYTRHGFALNVNPDLTHFEAIVPCGISEASVTSMQRELGVEIPISKVEYRVAAHFESVFETDVHLAPPLDSSVEVTLGSGEVLRGPCLPGEEPALAARRMAPGILVNEGRRVLIPREEGFPIRLEERVAFTEMQS